MTFFVPVLTEDAQVRLWNLHREHALLAACMLECYEVGREWASSVARPDEFGQGLVGAADPTRSTNHLVAVGEALAAQAESDGDLVTFEATVELTRALEAEPEAKVTGARLGEIVNRLSEGRDENARTALQSAAEMFMSRSSPAASESVRRARARRRKAAAELAKQGAAPAKIHGAVRRDKLAAWHDFVEQFAHLTVSIPEGIRRNAVVFTGFDTRDIADVLRRSGGEPWTLERRVRFLLQRRDEDGSLPTLPIFWSNIPVTPDTIDAWWTERYADAEKKLARRGKTRLDALRWLSAKPDRANMTFADAVTATLGGKVAVRTTTSARRGGAK